MSEGQRSISVCTDRTVQKRRDDIQQHRRVDIKRSKIETFHQKEDNMDVNQKDCTINHNSTTHHHYRQTSNGNSLNVEKLHADLKKKKLFVLSKFVTGGKLKITSDMLEQTPIAERISYEHIYLSVKGRKWTTKIKEVLINEDDPCETLPIVGCSGSGKTVYAKMAFRYYVDNNKIPFLLKVREMNDDECLLEFADFIRDYVSPKFSMRNNTEIVELLRENEEDCVFIVDGLDQSQMDPFPFGKTQKKCGTKTTAFIWLYRLFTKKVMEHSKVIFTSREASMAKLGLSFAEVYRLKGFTDEGKILMMKLHDENVDAEQLNSFIQSKGESFSNFASTPVILSIITWMYKTKPEELEATSTLASLYRLILDKHHTESERQREKVQQLRPVAEATNLTIVYKKVDKMFYELLNDSKYSFTPNELEKHDLSWGDVDSYTMVIAENLDDPKNVRYTPTHQSMQEFHASQYIVKDMDLENFRKLVDEKLFSAALQDNWKMVQDFVHDILDTENDDTLAEKKNYFVGAKAAAEAAAKSEGAEGRAEPAFTNQHIGM